MALIPEQNKEILIQENHSLKLENFSLKGRIETLIKTFKHCHIADKGNGYESSMDICKECGLDIRNEIHH